MEAQLYIDGQFTPAASGQTGPVHEKATGKQLGTYAKATKEDIDRAVLAARQAQQAWAATSAPERSNLLLKFAEVLQGRFDELVEQSMRETGGSTSQG
ncbi:aldehyde dehydrogenase family protein [Kibdelosporangium aridum]|uniref:aldehyde dehydrogenase family protein n=1 Tax=Kibdelosporangium aridum TaxID=2030 RepID=UPI0035EED3EC